VTFTTLIAPDTLARHLGNPDWALVDCRFSLDDPAWGAREYRAGHIPGALFVDVARDLSGTKTGRNGRHPLPDPDVLRATLGRLGIDATVQVVGYDQDAGMYASRLWWLLRWMGHTAVAVLDGGYARWRAEGLPSASGAEHRPACRFSGDPNRGMLADAEEIARLSRSPLHRIVDARAPERFRGDVEPIDAVAGHIPGAVNHPYRANVTNQGTFLAPEDLRRRWTATLGGLTGDRVVTYCGSGVTACQNILALEHAGLPGARLYPGSWSEWSSDPDRAVARGEE
jgi:thiosulfate/3-mercaptopyruvate sulfurtransferase